jgi:hypothetical protein
MYENLELVTWAARAGFTVSLADIERPIVERLQPPLNLKGLVTAWTADISQKRETMAGEARRWADAAHPGVTTSGASDVVAGGAA